MGNKKVEKPGSFMQRPGGLQGKVAIVTGAGRGIGRAIATALAAEGAAVVVASRTVAEIEATSDLLKTAGQVALAIATDVSKYNEVKELVDRTLEEFGRIDVLVNDAGIQGPIGLISENEVVDWNATIQTNLLGTFYCTQMILPHMIEQRHGKIINLSGGGAAVSRPYFSAYAASKAAVVRLTETVAEEVKEHNIQVNAIAPGAVNTRMLDEMLKVGKAAGEKTFVEARQQLKSGGTPPEVGAELVAFLASDASTGLTGKLIAALHDDWQTWDAAQINELMSMPWFTLRRIDRYTFEPLLAHTPGR